MTRKQQKLLSKIDVLKVKPRTKKRLKLLKEWARQLVASEKYEATKIPYFKGPNQNPCRDETQLEYSGHDDDHRKHPFLDREFYQDGVLLEEDLGDGVYA